MLKKIAFAVGAASLLTLSFGACAATQTGASSPDSSPLAASALPYAPAFAPTSAHADVFQNYVYGNWNYKIQYVYSSQLGRWFVWGYSARLVALPDGTPVTVSQANPGSDGKIRPLGDGGPCPPIKPQAVTKTGGAGPAGVVDPASCDQQPPPPPPPSPAPPYQGRFPGDSNTQTVHGPDWTTSTTYTWLQEPGTPNYGWYLTGFVATQN